MQLDYNKIFINTEIEEYSEIFSDPFYQGYIEGFIEGFIEGYYHCLLYTSDAADE